MKDLLTNLRLAAGITAQHLADDPALFLLQVSHRMPAAIVQPSARLVSSRAVKEPHSSSALLAGLLVGEEREVVRRLEVALSHASLPANRARAMADIALVAGRTDLADRFLARAAGARRLKAAMARRYWHSGALSPAVEVLEDAEGGAERRQHGRLAAELRVLGGSRPRLAPVGFEPLSGRVLHLLTNSLPHTASGYAQRSHSILLAQRASGWDAMAVTRVGYPVQVGKITARHSDVMDGITYQRLLPRHMAVTVEGRLQQQAEEMLAVAREFRPSILHTTTPYVNAIVTQAVAEALNIPWIYEVRGQLADTWAASRGPEARESEKYRLFQAREADAMNAADLVVTLGQSMKKNIISAGVPGGKILVAPNAVGGEYLAEPMAPAAARLRLGLDPEAHYVGTVSSLVAYEGVDDLIKAFERLAPGHPRLKLLIVGDGAALPALREQARSVNLGERVIFAGRVPRADAHLYHQALDVFAVPRKDLEVTRSVTPLKPIEALASARPVVASNLPALREIVTEGTNGLLCNAEDPVDLAAKLEVLLADGQQRDRMGRNGRRRVLKTRTWTSNAQSMGAAYERMLEKLL